MSDIGPKGVHLILSQMPMEFVDLMEGQGVQELQDEGDRKVMPAYIQ